MDSEAIRAELLANLEPGEFAPQGLVNALAELELVRSYGHYQAREELKRTSLGENDPMYSRLVEAHIVRDSALKLSLLLDRVRVLEEALTKSNDLWQSLRQEFVDDFSDEIQCRRMREEGVFGEGRFHGLKKPIDEEYDLLGIVGRHIAALASTPEKESE